MMFNINEVIKIHAILIETFGGDNGLRDLNLLNSAINRPFQTFDLKDLYPSPAEKASAIIESIIVNHPFIDGNKRLGYTLMRLILMHYKTDLNASQNDKFDFVMNIAKGNFKYEDILNWINTHLTH